MWNDLTMSKRVFVVDLWCLGRDFNVVMSKDERRGRPDNFNIAEME